MISTIITPSPDACGQMIEIERKLLKARAKSLTAEEMVRRAAPKSHAPQRPARATRKREAKGQLA